MRKKHTHIHTKNCTEAQHHLHMRKRMSVARVKKFELTLIDKLVFIAGPLIPIAVAPTAYTVWVKEEVTGISLITWGTLSFTSFIMANYAVIHKEKVLVITYIPLFLLNIFIVVGVLLKS
jgi:hypothetical protein